MLLCLLQRLSQTSCGLDNVIVTFVNFVCVIKKYLLNEYMYEESIKTLIVKLKGKHNEKSSPIFMSLSCSYVCMHTPGKKITIKEPFTLEVWAAKDLTFNYFLLWAGLHGMGSKRCVTAGHKNGRHLWLPGSYQKEMSRSSKGPGTRKPADHSKLCVANCNTCHAAHALLLQYG